MASSFVSRQRNQQRNTPPVAIKPFVRAAQNFALQTKQNREITDGSGQSMGTEVYTEIRATCSPSVTRGSRMSSVASTSAS
jgi:hypothetical protein